MKRTWTFNFPDWFEPEWHTCLAGCIRMPETSARKTKQALRYIDGEGFDESETALFLKGVKVEDLPIPTREKMERNDMLTVLDVLPRNLAVLVGELVK